MLLKRHKVWWLRKMKKFWKNKKIPLMGDKVFTNPIEIEG